MKVKIFPQGQGEPIEFTLNDYKKSDLEPLKTPYFSAVGENCYMRVVYHPDNNDEKAAMAYMNYHKDGYNGDTWTVLAIPEVEPGTGEFPCGTYTPRICQEQIDFIDKCLKKDKKVLIDRTKINKL